ncbi:hypothetical protein [Mycobacterium sp. IDR2000157661]|uniref:hypothetical protein n=1 Tax=Mycobacterium sp. IDR2000157661 TaxID=2867005 RepID=UPI001EEC3DB9|nr:hypothetical protein [Mycobacterium sp. IDR2000157661]
MTSSALDAQARADISSRPWYVVAARGRDVVNVQEFSTLRPGRRLMSRNWNGFRLFEDPAYLAYAGGRYAHRCLPWEVWQVKPIRPLRYEPTSLPGFTTRQLRARRIEVVQRMTPGFEYGPYGRTVRALVERLAQVVPPQRPDPADRDYEIALTFLEEQRGHGGWLHDCRVSLATAYLDCLTSGSSTGPAGRWKHYLPTELPVHTLLDATISGLPIPHVVAQRWNLTEESSNRS